MGLRRLLCVAVLGVLPLGCVSVGVLPLEKGPKPCTLNGEAVPRLGARLAMLVAHGNSVPWRARKEAIEMKKLMMLAFFTLLLFGVECASWAKEGTRGAPAAGSEPENQKPQKMRKQGMGNLRKDRNRKTPTPAPK